MTKGSFIVVEYVFGLHPSSPRVVMLKVGLQYESPRVVKVEIRLHHG